MTHSEQYLDRLNSYIDLDNYPIHEPESQAAIDVVKRGHEMMRIDTLCLFDSIHCIEVSARLSLYKLMSCALMSLLNGTTIPTTA